MEKKAKYTVLIKILGAAMVLIASVGFIVLKDTDLKERAVWEFLYMLSIFAGGLFNLLDFGKGIFSTLAFISYLLSAVFSVSIGLVFSGSISGDFLLVLTAVLISMMRFLSIFRKPNGEGSSWKLKPVVRKQPSGGGCLAGVIGMLLFLLGLYILGVRLKFYIFLLPIS